MNSIDFLEVLFADEVCDQWQLSIFSLPDKAVRRFASISEAAAYGEHQGQRQDVYFGLGLIAGNPKGRGKLADIAGIGCLWADIDLAGYGHQKPNLPPDINATQNILEKLGPYPSLLVHSGGGLHAYWVFKEVWLFDNNQERRQAAVLSQRWASTVRATAKSQGYDLDAVGDLTRVLRLPGTFNRKGPEPVEVRVLQANQYRYCPDDFDMYLVAEEYAQANQPVQVEAISLSADDEPPMMKLFALLDNDPKFKRTWNRKRTDLQDQSPSAYDLSAASIAVNAGWSDQEIADLIIGARRMNKEDISKALRRDYIQRTIGKAKAGLQQDREISELTEQASALQNQLPEKCPQVGVTGSTVDQKGIEKKQKLLRGLSRTLGVPIVRWVQHGRENARYSLLLDNNEWVRIGPAANVLSLRRFRQAIYEATGKLIAPIKQEKWDDVCKILAVAAEFIENEEVASGYQAQQWVEAYLQDHPLWQGDWQEAANNNEPFEREQLLCIHAGELRKHMRIRQQEVGISHGELCECLRISGFRRVSVSAWLKGTVVRRSYWSKDLTTNNVKGEKNSEQDQTQ